MNEKYKIDDNGITIKKLFKSTHINFAEIQNITEDAEHNRVTTKSGETYDINLGFASLTHKYPFLFKYIEQYNIDFRSLDDIRDEAKIYTYDEALSIAHRTEELIRKYANEAVVDKLGMEFSVETDFYENLNTESGVYLILLKDGKVVELPKSRWFESEVAPGVFDQIELLFGPVMWDTVNRYGKYGVTVECDNEETCRKTVYECIDDLCIDYSKECRET